MEKNKIIKNKMENITLLFWHRRRQYPSPLWRFSSVVWGFSSEQTCCFPTWKKIILVTGVLTNTILLLFFNAAHEILIVKVINIFQVPEVPKKVVTEEISVKVPKKPEPPPAKGNCCKQWMTENPLCIILIN